jgi:hypothetical protein
MGSGGGAPQSSTTQNQTTKLPIWEQPEAKEYLASVANLIYGQGTTQPKNYIGNKNYHFGNGTAPGTGQAAGDTAGGTNGSAGGSGQVATPGLNPQLASDFVQPAVGNSSYLQNLNAQSPGAISNMYSPAAFNQMQMLYPQLSKQGAS